MHTETELTSFLIDYPSEMAFSGKDPGEVMDRWFVPGIVYRNDGLALDRQRLIDHVRPARKNAVDVQVDVHEALVSGQRIAAHYTLTATMRTGAQLATEIVMIGRLADDGRISEIDQLTRVLRTEPNA
ncbi:MAG: hypothetical protein JWN03_2536 [Nocardia sp.]|uniref:nuclear transport factor 2 family protein n=1 Tax=Nocardia sp. TaxID=1821 RepID=UPI002638C4BB|nr:nuclear transport factor 2 family protein [Nocardia sp.]MCU1642261.1 hypothetical protein [Nocardia sp.]